MRSGKIFVGTIVVTNSGHNYVRLWTDAAFKSTFGRNFDGAKDFVGVMNGAAKDSPGHCYGAEHWYGDGVYVYFANSFTGPVRINYLVALNP